MPLSPSDEPLPPTADATPGDPPWTEIRAAYEGSDLAVAAIARA